MKANKKGTLCLGMVVFVVLLFGSAPMALAFGPHGIGAQMTDQEMDQVRGGVGFIFNINLRSFVNSLEPVSGDIVIAGVDDIDVPEGGLDGVAVDSLGGATIFNRGNFNNFSGIALVTQVQGQKICVLNYLTINCYLINNANNNGTDINGLLSLL